MRTYPHAQRLRMLNDVDRRIVPVDGPANVAATRADRATGADGTLWCVDGTHTLRRIGLDGVTSTIDLSGRTATGPTATGPPEMGTVRWTTPDAFTDPANADVVARITVDVSRFQWKAE